MTTSKNLDFISIGEVSSLVEADFTKIEKRVLAISPAQIASVARDVPVQIVFDDEPTKASDFIDPTIKNAVLTLASQIPIYRGIDLGTEFHPSDRPKLKASAPNKRAKTKAARKQRRKQK